MRVCESETKTKIKPVKGDHYIFIISAKDREQHWSYQGKCLDLLGNWASINDRSKRIFIMRDNVYEDL